VSLLHSLFREPEIIESLPFRGSWAVKKFVALLGLVSAIAAGVFFYGRGADTRRREQDYPALVREVKAQLLHDSRYHLRFVAEEFVFDTLRGFDGSLVHSPFGNGIFALDLEGPHAVVSKVSLEDIDRRYRAVIGSLGWSELTHQCAFPRPPGVPGVSSDRPVLELTFRKKYNGHEYDARLDVAGTSIETPDGQPQKYVSVEFAVYDGHTTPGAAWGCVGFPASYPE
jgi:hypothetical protein